MIFVNNKKILIFHNIPAPYRIPLFNKLSEKYNLLIVFMQKKEDGRLWEYKNNYIFNFKFLPRIDINLFNKNICFNKGINDTLMKFDPDIVIGLDNPPNLTTTLLLLVSCKKYRIPFLLWSGIYPYYNLDSGVIFKIGEVYIKAAREVMYRNTDSFVVYSKGTQNLLMNKYDIDNKIIFKGTQGHAESLVQQFYSEPNYCKKYTDNIILFVGYLRHSPNKGLRDLIRSFKYFYDKFDVGELIIIGDGPLKVDLEKKAKNYPIKFLGYLEGKRKYHWFKKAKVLIIPSYGEPWGWVINEAFYFNLPVIASSKMMAKEMIDDGKNGYLVDPGNINDIYSKLKKVIELEYNDYKKMAKYAKNISKKYNLNYSLECFNRAIESTSV